MIEDPDRDVLLCVDDEEFVLSALKRTFSRRPYRLVLAANAAEALEVMEREPVRVVISDQRMPGVSGTELLRAIKDRWPQAIRIILSAYAEVPVLLKAINEGEVYRFIAKPWNDQMLLDLIDRAMEQSRVVGQMMVLARILESSSRPENQIRFKVDYLGNLIRMELTESKRPLSTDQIAEILEKIFNLRPGSQETKMIGGALHRQNGKLTFITEVGNNLELILEFPVVKQEEKE